ncbi:MAG: C-type lectin domain-containing protein [Deltaproteobacteria bacterium]|nr:C-type lectin domain-containing protein [Deltaproteobacteria bacterium]
MRHLVVALVALTVGGCAFDRAGLGGDELLSRDDAASDTTVSSDAILDTIAEDTSTDTSADTSADTPADSSVVADTFADVAVDTGVVDVGSDVADAPDARDADAADAADAAVVPCTDPGGVLSGGHCYFPIAATGTFAAQRDACIARGAHLAAITSGAEQGVAAGRGTGDRWIGLIKDSTAPSAKSSFRWITGESSAVYDHWAAGDPSTAGRKCPHTSSDGPRYAAAVAGAGAEA